MESQRRPGPPTPPAGRAWAVAESASEQTQLQQNPVAIPGSQGSWVPGCGLGDAAKPGRRSHWVRPVDQALGLAGPRLPFLPDLDLGAISDPPYGYFGIAYAWTVSYFSAPSFLQPNTKQGGEKQQGVRGVCGWSAYLQSPVAGLLPDQARPERLGRTAWCLGQ